MARRRKYSLEELAVINHDWAKVVRKHRELCAADMEGIRHALAQSKRDAWNHWFC